MSNRKKRTYSSATREAQAAQTRSRILASAKELFHSEGFEAVTVEKLAQSAQVSAPTIYGLFQSKRGVLRALMDEALPPKEYEALVKKAMQAKSAKGLLLITAKISRQLYDAECAQMAVFHGASVLGPEFKELEKERELRRYKRLEKTAYMIVKENPRLAATKMRDILWAFTGRDLYRMLVVERGWSSEDYEKWLAQLLIDNCS